MTHESILKYVENSEHKDKALQIHFKNRNTLSGLFIRGKDFDELRAKNFWRVVINSKIDQWKKTKDFNLARIFNGTEFTRISE